jgi:N-acetylneuraminic acid mutarotase
MPVTPIRLRRSTALRLFLVGWCAAVAFAPGAADAHFLWLTAEHDAGGPAVHAYLSETPTPDGPEFLARIARAEITTDGRPWPWTRGEETYRVAVPKPPPKTIDGFCDLGVMRRNDITFRLLYTARLQVEPAPTDALEAGDHLRLRLVARPGKPPLVQVAFRGKPAAKAVVKAFPQTGDPVELKADDEGRLENSGIGDGPTAFLARWTEKSSGVIGGKAFDEIRYYATLTVAPGLPRADGATFSPTPFALLPEAVNSFGGAVLGDWLYVYSGHVGETHKYHQATTTKHFRRLNLRDHGSWEELPAGPALQGVTLVAHRNALYRIGGMSAKNRPGDAQDLMSVSDFARYDPDARKWTDLPPLPAPRSTHDAVVLDDRIYVVGGWAMNGGGSENAEFQQDALVFDLARPDAHWEKLPKPPFRRRALALGAARGKLYVLGGLCEDASVVRTVDIYDVARQTWSRGPDLPGERLQGFAPSAFGVNDHLYVTGNQGLVHRLRAAGDGWDVVGKVVVPRLTHRLLPGIADDLLVVGGNFAGVPTRLIESIPLDVSEPGPKVLVCPVSVPAEARQACAVGRVRSKFLIVGGNRTTDPHGFSPENLVAQAFAVDFAAQTTEPLPPLPEPRQSSALIVGEGGRAAPAYLLGGIGADGGVARSLGDVFRLDADRKSWTKLAAAIPDGRGMFGAVSYKGAVWIFGGSVFDPRTPGPEPTMPTDILRSDAASDGSHFAATPYRLPRPRRSFAGTTVGSKYYLVGGLGAGRAPVEPVDVFDFDTATWSTIPAPKPPRLFAELAALDGKLYLAGGFVAAGSHHFEPATSLEVYDPATGRWTTLLPRLPIAAERLHMVAVQNRLVLFALDPAKAGEASAAFIAP